MDTKSITPARRDFNIWGLLCWLNPEELVYLSFFIILAVISLVEGQSHLNFAQDRLGYTFLLIGIAIITFRVNCLLWYSSNVPWAELFAEGKRSFVLIRNIFSVLMCWAMYSSIKMILPESTLRDDWLIAADRAIFGFDPVVALEKFITPSLTSFMVANYILLFLYIPGVFLFLTLKNNQRGLRDFLLGLIMASFLGYLGYLAVPAIGPQHTQGHLFSIDLWQRDARVLAQSALEMLVDLNRIKRDCFPSMHVCLALLCLLYSWRWLRGFFWVLLPATLCLIFSTFYLRYHYVIDAVAGIALAAAVYSVTPAILDWWNRKTAPFYISSCSAKGISAENKNF
ncbi:MAG: phosphatase PAP2 family protein [Candidatus Riflebacteria bacterium]|nr:phosphatase PAP2 family protein [Candidatus Riflebacteria bacterium]